MPAIFAALLLLMELVMSELKNDRYLRALLRQSVDVTPV